MAGLDDTCTDSISIKSYVEDVYLHSGELIGAKDIKELSTLTLKKGSSFKKIPALSGGQSNDCVFKI